MRWKTACILLIALLLAIGIASAETESIYDRLNAGASLNASSDVCAWLEIPGTGFVQPVMQHASDVSFYLDHDAGGNENPSGALYTEFTYSAADFSDPVTVIYGKRRSDGSMFGSLQEWFSGSFDKLPVIRLHMPEGTREYQVFAAVPYSGIHLLYYNDFRYPQVYNSFFDSVYSTRRLGVQLADDLRPVPGEAVIILSTGLRGDTSQRYLVMAKSNNEFN